MYNNGKIKEEAISWVTLEKEGLSKNKKNELEYWLKSNPLHEIEYKKIKAIYSFSKSISKSQACKLSQNVHSEIRKEKLFYKVRKYSSIAALFLVIIFIGFNTYNVDDIAFSKTYITDTSNMVKQKLPDGSIISLDAKTNLYIKFLKKKRIAILKNGRVMFHISKDKSRPFIISSNNVKIEVVGTKFEVISTDKTTKVNVEEGKVKTYYENQNGKKTNVIILTKSDTITYSNLGKVKDYLKINPNTIAIWRDDLINFDKSSLKNALTQFAKYSHVSFIFNSKEVEDYIISGEFSSNQWELFLNTVSKIYPIKISKIGESIKISKKIKN